MDAIIDNKRIARNTVVLYVRMLFTLFVSLFTSRLILGTLGFEDYGLYSVVGGIIVLFTFLNSTMAVATQRFLSFEIGKGDTKSVNEVFCVCLTVHIIIAAIIFIIAETVGLWFLFHKLNIPEYRIFAAHVVYQLSVITTLLGITQIPYNAIIIAKEKMNVFAFISIFEVMLKLFLVILLVYVQCDKLILYSILMTLNSCIIIFIYRTYCVRKFPESKFLVSRNSDLYKQISSFTGWNLSANLVLMARTQGVNILINIYSGLTVNAARSIAIQVNTMIMQFVSNFQVAVNPQINKLCAVGNNHELIKLVKRSSKFSFLLLSLLIFPFIFEADTILRIWLGNVPDYSVAFTRFVLIATLCDNLSGTLATAALATGNVKRYQIVMSSLLSLCFFISWLILYMGYQPVYVYTVDSAIYLISLFARLILLKSMIGIHISEYFRDVVFRCCLSILPVILCGWIFISNIDVSVMRFFIAAPTMVTVSALSSFFLALDTNEKLKLCQTVKSKIYGRNKNN